MKTTPGLTRFRARLLARPPYYYLDPAGRLRLHLPGYTPSQPLPLTFPAE